MFVVVGSTVAASAGTALAVARRAPSKAMATVPTSPPGTPSGRREGKVAERGVRLDSAEQSILKRLREQAEELARTERHARAQRKRRDLLAAKLFRGGVPERMVAEAAGISGSAAHQLKDRLRRDGMLRA
jgi:hypothetical protein